MATQVSAMPATMSQNEKPAAGFIGQVIAVITQPTVFFRNLPQNRQWVLVAALILFIYGFAASNQIQTASTSSSDSGAIVTDGGFDLSLLQLDTESSSNMAAATRGTSANSSANSTLTDSLLAACEVIVMWAGQAFFLCLIPMLHGRAPQFAQSLKVAIWASIPLAIMLGLRLFYFRTGGAGGATGLSLLLEDWDAYSTLPETIQDILAVFMSHITLFWLWSLFLLYVGARFALRGRRWSVAIMLVLWITAGTIVPAAFGDPVTTTAPRVTVSSSSDRSTDTSNSNSSTTTQTDTSNMFQQGGMQNFGDMGGGFSPPDMGGSDMGGGMGGQRGG